MAISNNGGSSQTNAGFKVDGNGNMVILKNCIAINNAVGYYADSNTKQKLYDCKTTNNTAIKNGSGTFEIVNSDKVE